MSEHLALLLRLHDGDDRCGCLRAIIGQLLLDGSEANVQLGLEFCLQNHPAGSRYRG